MDPNTLERLRNLSFKEWCEGVTRTERWFHAALAELDHLRNVQTGPESEWEYKTTPGSDHEYCTVYEAKASGRAIARHVLPENARQIAALPELLDICNEILVDAEKAVSPAAQQHMYRELKAAIASAEGEE
jgi:hypothetical protein